MSRNLRNSNKYRVPFARLESYRRSFFPMTLSNWNSLDDSIREKPTLDSFTSSFVQPEDAISELLYYGSRWPSIHHARMRIGCSKLNAHLCYNLHVLASPRCPCGNEIEDPTHFFFHCPLFNAPRQKMLASLLLINNIDININSLLWGDADLNMKANEMIFSAVHSYIIETSRFD